MNIQTLLRVSTKILTMMFNFNCINVLEIDLFFPERPKIIFLGLCNFLAFEGKFKKNELIDLTALSGGEELDEKHAKLALPIA